jgi:hypothetical protein
MRLPKIPRKGQPSALKLHVWTHQEAIERSKKAEKEAIRVHQDHVNEEG